MRLRLYPTPEQETPLLGHCGHARYAGNLAVRQLSDARPGRGCPNFAERCRQLAEARREHEWLAAGSSIVRQQAPRDFGQAMANWRGGTPRRPTWRKRGRHEGFRIVNPPKVDRFSNSDDAVRHTGLDITVYSSDTKRSPGHLARQEPQLLRWAL